MQLSCVFLPFLEWAMNIRNKKLKKNIPVCAGILVMVLLLVLVADNIWMHRKMMRIATQITYLQDTASIIQTDVGTMQSNIEETLQEENSILESCSIEVVDTDFAAGTYQVAITAIPKEYTDKTKMSVFLGTREYPLEQDGFTFTGEVELKLSQSYAGNVTVLITNGTKRNTEVLSKYEGFQEKFDDVLSGTISEVPTYNGGNLSLKAEVEFNLQGTADTYGVSEFSQLKLIVDAGGQRLYEEELITSGEEKDAKKFKNPVDFLVPAIADVMEEEDSQMPDAGEDVEDDEEDTMIVKETVDGVYGSKSVRIRQEVPEDTEVVVYLQAVSTDGFTFRYELFHDMTSENGGFITTGADASPEDGYMVFDRKGGRYVPPENSR